MRLLTLLTVVCLPIISNIASPIGQNQNDLDQNLIRAYLSIDGAKEFRVSSSQKIFFKNEIGIFRTYEGADGEILGSILTKGTGSSLSIEAYYLGDFKPFSFTNNPIFYVTPLDFFNSRNDALLFENSDYFKSFSSSRITSLADYPHDDATKYFPVNLDTHLKREGGSTYYEGLLIKDVPNYMNTMYNHMGCSPTTAAMYFAYIDRASRVANNLFNPDMPLKHTDDINRVNNLITYIGDNYFKTTTIGTYTYLIPGQTAKYLNDHGLYGYKGFTTTRYEDFFYSISYAANPCHLSIPGHSMLGIGTKDVWASPTTPRWVTCQAVYNDTMATIGIPATKVTEYYLIHK